MQPQGWFCLYTILLYTAGCWNWRVLAGQLPQYPWSNPATISFARTQFKQDLHHEQLLAPYIQNSRFCYSSCIHVPVAPEPTHLSGTKKGFQNVDIDLDLDIGLVVSSGLLHFLDCIAIGFKKIPEKSQSWSLRKSCTEKRLWIGFGKFWYQKEYWNRYYSDFGSRHTLLYSREQRLRVWRPDDHLIQPAVWVKLFPVTASFHHLFLHSKVSPILQGTNFTSLKTSQVDISFGWLFCICNYGSADQYGNLTGRG